MTTTRQTDTSSIVHEQAQQALRATSADDLLTKFAQLTHRIHEAVAQCGSGNAHQPHRYCKGLAVGAPDLRAQRDLIRAEILRRAGD